MRITVIEMVIIYLLGVLASIAILANAIDGSERERSCEGKEGRK